MFSNRMPGSALFVQFCAAGLSQLVSSSVPGRIVITCGEDSANTREAHRAQKRTMPLRPLGISRSNVAGSPFVTANAARGEGMERPNAEPDWRWQSVQWQR